MATENAMQTVSYVAGADLSTHQFKFVKLNSSGQIILASALGEAVIGVLQDNPIAGQPGQVCIGGQCKLKMGAAVAAGTQVTTTAAAVGAVAASTQQILGFVSEATTGAFIGSIVFQPQGAKA